MIPGWAAGHLPSRCCSCSQLAFRVTLVPWYGVGDLVGHRHHDSYKNGKMERQGAWFQCCFERRPLSGFATKKWCHGLMNSWTYLSGDFQRFPWCLEAVPWHDFMPWSNVKWFNILTDLSGQSWDDWSCGQVDHWGPNMTCGSRVRNGGRQVTSHNFPKQPKQPKGL